MNVNAIFVKSSASVSECPRSDKPEYAFIGRSNVGKSSLINSLCLNGSLAKTSSTPGKTRLINHFLVNDSWFLVDLPGYGYAKVARSTRRDFDRNLFRYLTERRNLCCVFVLIDSRLKPQAIDLAFINRLGELQIPFALIFTKIDKSTQRELSQNKQLFREEMLKTWEEMPPSFDSSTVRRVGREEILAYIEETKGSFLSPIEQ